MKKKIVRMKKKLNNAGMTLIEVLVAMALLVIAIIPLSGGYIYSAKHSAKAKHMQQTSILAHTMIENCKAYSVEEIEDLVTAGTFIPNTTTHVWDTSITDGYQFYFDDVVVYDDGAGNRSSQVYDLSMRIKPVTSMEKDIMLYSNMNKYADAMILPNQTMDTTNTYTPSDCDVAAYEYACSMIATEVNNVAAGLPSGVTFTPATKDTVAVDLQSGVNAGKLTIDRKIIINPKLLNAGSNLQQADIIYRYSFNFSGTYSYSVLNSGVTQTIIVPVSGALSSDKDYVFKVFDNSTSGANADLKNVYLFYYPTYNPNNIDFNSDVIEVQNALNESFNLYVMKQLRQDMTLADISIVEAGYTPTLSVAGGHDIKVFHNLKENLGGGSTTGWSKTTALNVVWQELHDLSDPLAEYESLVDDIPKKLMYTVEVSVHPSDSYSNSGGVMSMTRPSLASMDGTFLDW